MSEYDAATYERFSGAVRRQVHSLRIILDNLQVISNNGLRKYSGPKGGPIPKLLEKSYPSPNQPVRETSKPCQNVCVKL